MVRVVSAGATQAGTHATFRLAARPSSATGRSLQPQLLFFDLRASERGGFWTPSAEPKGRTISSRSPHLGVPEVLHNEIAGIAPADCPMIVLGAPRAPDLVAKSHATTEDLVALACIPVALGLCRLGWGKLLTEESAECIDEPIGVSCELEVDLPNVPWTKSKSTAYDLGIK